MEAPWLSIAGAAEDVAVAAPVQWPSVAEA